MKKFSYKDFIDGITASLPYDRTCHSRRVSPKIVNIVWKESVKYILRELQHNREVYLPYIGYISLKEQDEDLTIPVFKGSDRRLKVKKFDYVEFKPFKIFLDMLNQMDANDDKKLNKVMDRAHINEVDFVKQDYDEYMEEYVEPFYDESDVEFTKEIIKGSKSEDDILAKIANGTYTMLCSPVKRNNEVYVKYTIGDSEPIVERYRQVERDIGMKLSRVYSKYQTNGTKCNDTDIEIDYSDIKKDLKIWLLGNKEQARKKGYNI